MRVLDFRHPRIKASTRATTAQARRTLAVVLADNVADAKTVAKQWKGSRVAGELVLVRRQLRRVKCGGAAVELHVVTVSLRPPRPVTAPPAGGWST